MNFFVGLVGLVLKCVWAFLELLFNLLTPSRLKSVEGQLILITGAGQGIGRELAMQLSRLGADLVLWDINEPAVKETAAKVKREVKSCQVYAVKCDVSSRDEVGKAAQKTGVLTGGRAVDVLINNAGIMPAKPLLNFKPEEVEKIFSVNVYSHFWTIFEYLPGFLSRDAGHVVCICSMAGITGTPYLAPYCASKFALKGLMDALFFEMRQDYPDSKVKLTTVHPFTVNTGLAHEPFTNYPWIVPIVEPKMCAEHIIEAFRRNLEEIFVPKHLQPFSRMGKTMPRKVQLAINDFLNCGVGYEKKQ